MGLGSAIIINGSDMRQQKMKLRVLIIAAFSVFWISFVAQIPSVIAADTSYQKDQAIDEKYNFFQLFSNYINKLRINSFEHQPAEVRSGGLPPFHQEKERAENVGLDPTAISTTPCVPSKGHPC